MLEIAHITYWGALAAFGGATLLFAYSAAFGTEAPGRGGMAAMAAGLAALSLSLGLRWAATGHGPYLGGYEAFGSYAWGLGAFYLLAAWRLPRLRPAGVTGAPAAFLLLGAGVLSPAAPQFESPAMRSLWLWIHVGMAKLSLASLVLAAGVSLVYLRRRTAFATASGPGGVSSVALSAGMPELEELSVRLTSLGFLLLAVVIGSGALWANTAWGAYWSWDPIESWALGTWVLYGLALHFHRLWRVSGDRWAWLNMGILGASMLLFATVWLLTRSPHWIYLG